jgi:hypothetical protein
MKPRRYRNCPVTIDGEYYDSKREAIYHNDLKNLQRAGQITALKRQPEFVCEVDGQKICKYIADFSCIENGRLRIIDVKSPITAKDPVFRLKRKLVEALHRITIEVVL